MPSKVPASSPSSHGSKDTTQGSEPWLQLTELYRSIQGESRFAGEACIFVRTTGCNLRCVWCDSAYTFSGGQRFTLQSILDEIERLGPGLVELTGGEPLLQAATIPLMQGLLELGRTVLLETSGSISLAAVPKAVHKIVDLKAPGSGELEANLWENLNLLGPGDELKIVLADEADYLWARKTIQRRRLDALCGAVLLSPVQGTLDPALLVEWMLRDRLPARLNLQLHKIVWPHSTSGV